MKKSIVQSDPSKCYLCGKNGAGDRLEKHHIFGAYNRKKSEEDGEFVWLCGDACHRNGPNAAHRSKETSRRLHEEGQRAWEKVYGTRAEFLKRYKKNYLEEEENAEIH